MNYTNAPTRDRHTEAVKQFALERLRVVGVAGIRELFGLEQRHFWRRRRVQRDDGAVEHVLQHREAPEVAQVVGEVVFRFRAPQPTNTGR